jgi:hypothetical protein
MKTSSLMYRVLQLEAEGKVEKGVALIVAELRATKILRSPEGNLTVPDHRRQLAAVDVVFSLFATYGNATPTRPNCAS